MSQKDNTNKKPDYSFKILFLGNAEVGKTSIILRYTKDKFQNEQLSTIGIDFKSKTIKYKAKSIKLNIFDTAGQERFRALTRNYYKDVDGIIMVFDVKRQETFDTLTYWMSEVNNYCNIDEIGLLLVGNKVDGNIEERQVKKEEGTNISSAYKFKYIETSALTNENIKECFDLLIDSIIDKKGIKIDDNNIHTLSSKSNCSRIVLKKNSNINGTNNYNVQNNNSFCASC